MRRRRAVQSAHRVDGHAACSARAGSLASAVLVVADRSSRSCVVALQPARPAAQPRRQRVGAGRRPAQAPLRPDPEPRRDGQGLRRARARDVRGGHAGARARAGGAGAGRAGRGRRHPQPGARPAVRGRRGLPGAAGERELPPAADAARRDREPDRRLAPGLQRHRAHVQQRDPDGARRACSPACSGSRRSEFFEVEDAATARRHASRSSRAPPSRRRSSLAGDAAAEVVRRCRAADVVVAGRAGRRVSSSTESITFAFSGDFSGAYRDIPLRDGESIDHDHGRRRATAATAPAAAPSSAAPARPARSASTRPGDGVRIVWHYRARPTSAHVHGPLPAARASPSPTTTSSTSTSGLGRRVGDRARRS